MRLFLGLPVPSELAANLARAAHALDLPNSRPIPAENIHLTLVFLGQVGEDRLPAIIRELNQLNVEPIQLRFTNLDMFPRAGVLFAEIEPTQELLHLQAQAAARMVACGFPLDDRPYHPHVTLARLRSPVRLTAKQAALPVAAQSHFKVDTVNLYRSHTLPTGAEYEVVAHKNATIG